jgi:hypothetical protein
VIRPAWNAAATDAFRRGFPGHPSSCFGEEQATEQLEIAARWGRSAERFEFDAKTPQFCIEREAEPDTVRAGGGVRKC